MSGDEFGIYFHPELAVARVKRARFAMLWRLGWTLALIALAVGLRVAYPDEFADSTPWFIGSIGVVGAVLFVWQLAQFLLARGEAARVQAGLAMGVNRNGVLVRQTWFPWPEVGSITMLPGRFGGSSRLVATGRDASREEVLIDYTDALPASLDSAIVALSAGRARVDLSRLDA